MSKQTAWTLVLLATMAGLGACQREGAEGPAESPGATSPGQQPAPPATAPGEQSPGGAGESGTGGTNQ